MQKTDTMPLWVYLVFSSIETRRGTVRLIWAYVLFTLYCLPWSRFFAGHDWVGKLFLIDDWSWFAMMVPVIVWNWMSLRWVDNNSGWPGRLTASKEQA